MARKCQEARRTTGFAWPPSFRQLLLAVAVLANCAAFCGLVRGIMEGAARLAFLAIFTVSFVTMLISGIWASALDPIDPLAMEDAEELEDEDLDDVLYCRLCDSNVALDSRHCYDCKKCVNNFDHHCPWLNTCIGTRNYFLFFVAIWSALIMVGAVVAAAAMLLEELVRYNFLPQPLPGRLGPSTLGLSPVALLVLCSVTVALGLACWVPLVTLVAFHCYLCYLGTTTFDYFTGKITKRLAEREGAQQRGYEEEEEEEDEEEEVDEASPGGTSGWGSSSASTGKPSVEAGSGLAAHAEEAWGPAFFRAQEDGLRPFGRVQRSFNQRASEEEEEEEEDVLEDLEDASDSSDSRSSEDRGGGADPMGGLFRPLAAGGEDSELRQEVSMFLFGSGRYAIGGTPTAQAERPVDASTREAPRPGARRRTRQFECC